MELNNLIIPTAVSHPGMTVAEVFRECVRSNVPGIPFQDESGHIIGKASIRHILKETCIPDYLVKHSHLLGDSFTHLSIPDDHVQHTLSLAIDPYVLTNIAVVSSNTPIAKALAIMEGNDATYMFVIDDGVYKGVVSIMGISKIMLEKL